MTTATSVCIHKWRIESNIDRTGHCKGACKLCGAEKVFNGCFDSMSNIQKQGIPFQYTTESKIHGHNLIKKYRLEVGMKQIELAEKIGITSSNMCAIEQGRLPAYPSYRQKIAKALGIKESILFP